MSTYADIETQDVERCRDECICPELVLPVIGRVASGQDAERIGELFSLLADPTRVRILHALSMSPELCVCDIAFLVEVSQSAVSHQMRTLRAAGVVARRKEGRTMFYSLSDEHVRVMLNKGLEHAGETRSHAQS